MAHGTWTTTGGGGGLITGGGVLAVIGAAVVIADWHGIERAAGELVAGLAVAVLVLGALALAGIVLLGRLMRRSEDRVAAELAERRAARVPAVQAATVRTARVLPAGQPQHVHYHLHGDAATRMFSGAVVSRGPGKPQISHYRVDHDEEAPR